MMIIVTKNPISQVVRQVWTPLAAEDSQELTL